VSWQRIYHSLTVTSNHKLSLLCTASFLSCHYSATANSENSTQFNSSAPKLISWQAGVSKLDSSLFDYCSLLFSIAEHYPITSLHEPHRKQSLAMDVLFLCAYACAGMCLLSRLAMDVCSGSTTPAFRSHVTICFILRTFWYGTGT
jgi:hypothetical protein